MSQPRPQGARFEGRIGRTLAESEPWFDEPPHPGELRRTSSSCCSTTPASPSSAATAPTSTPRNIDALAAGGLQFTNFHVTPLCSPTRASLLTGRSQHAVGMRALSNFRTGFPNQLGHISNHAATVAEVLASRGLRHVLRRQVAPRADGAVLGGRAVRPVAAAAAASTASTGSSRARPTSSTPTWCATTTRSTRRAVPSDGYHLSEDLVDQLLRMISDSKGVRPDRPFFAYLAVRRHPRAAPGAGRVPGEVPGRVRRGLGRRPPAVVRAPARARA